MLERISKPVVDFARSPVRLKDKRNSGESHYEHSMNLGFGIPSSVFDPTRLARCLVSSLSF